MALEVRARIAPSPTGYLHIGTARTALFNWLFAKKHNGSLILRIEDTDKQRSQPEYQQDIIDSLKWLGLNWDEGPFYQSQRSEIYQKYIKELLEKGFLYYCFCTEEELEKEREAMLAQGLPPKYSGKCRSLSPAEAARRAQTGEPFVLRIKTPDGEISFKDMIRGEVKFDAGLIGDIVVAKDEKTPLYNLAVVIDDEEMKISHVIRGEDHLPNTPKQIIIQQALGFRRPKYAHLPLILNPNRSKLSKRYAAVAVKEYKEQGYLPEAILNFLLLLGWHPVDDQEIFTKEEMIQSFSLDRVQKGGAVFNLDKLNWINTKYIRKLSDKELAEKLRIEPTPKNLKIIALTKERLSRLSDFASLTDFFYQLPDYPAQLLIWKDGSKEETKKYLEMIYQLDGQISETAIKQLAEQYGRGEVLWPFRVALSGKEGSPSPFEIMEVLGKEETLKRVKIAIEKLAS